MSGNFMNKEANMWRFLVVLCFLALPAQAQAPNWSVATETWIPSPDAPVLIRLNTYNGIGVQAFPEGQMVFVDLIPLGIPIDAIAVHIAGILIITHGTTPEICNLQLTMDGVSMDAASYIGQTIEAHIGGGQRTNVGIVAPVTMGQVGVQWDGFSSVTTQNWPVGCSYGVNLVIDAAFR